MKALRQFVGTTILSFAFGFIILNDWLMRAQYEMSFEPDPTRGLIYPCYPKFVPWYYSDFTIVRSWAFAAFGLLAVFANFVMLDSQRINSDLKSLLKPKVLVSISTGLLAAYVFVAFLEDSFVRLIMAYGFRPPNIDCFPMFSG